MTNIYKALFALFLSFFAANIAHSHSYKVADLEIKHPHARATLPNARVSGGYLTIINHGSASDRLIGVKVDFAGKAEIHEMKMENDVMKMRKLENGLEIPAGETSVLKPGGNHLMFMMLKEALGDGEKRKATLVFEKAGEVEVKLTIESMAKIRERAKSNPDDKDAMKEMDHSKMGHDKKDQGTMKHAN